MTNIVPSAPFGSPSIGSSFGVSCCNCPLRPLVLVLPFGSSSGPPFLFLTCSFYFYKPYGLVQPSAINVLRTCPYGSPFGRYRTRCSGESSFPTSFFILCTWLRHGCRLRLVTPLRGGCQEQAPRVFTQAKPVHWRSQLIKTKNNERKKVTTVKQRTNNSPTTLGALFWTTKSERLTNLKNKERLVLQFVVT